MISVAHEQVHTVTEERCSTVLRQFLCVCEFSGSNRYTCELSQHRQTSFFISTANEHPKQNNQIKANPDTPKKSLQCCCMHTDLRAVVQTWTNYHSQAPMSYQSCLWQRANNSSQLHILLPFSHCADAGCRCVQMAVVVFHATVAPQATVSDIQLKHQYLIKLSVCRPANSCVVTDEECDDGDEDDVDDGDPKLESRVNRWFGADFLGSCPAALQLNVVQLLA